MAILFVSCSSPTEYTPEDISLEQKIGQMLLIGFRGMEISETSTIAQDIKNGRVGGVILFDMDVAQNYGPRNIESPEQLKRLTAQLQSYAKIPLLIAIDQEGGKVNRLKTKYGFPASVSQQYLGNINNLDTTRAYANTTASTLKEMGINVNFAPVVDVNVNPENPVIGKLERSFSSDPNIVANHSKVVIEEHHKKNIKCSIKHFPGHGSSTADSHQGFVDVTNSWSNLELIPFKEIINANMCDMVMTAHIFNANLDPYYPATLSKNTLTNLLRNELGFNGVIVSDDMNMKAITDHYGLEQAIELALNAGVDILLFANNMTYDEFIAEKVISIIKKLINEGKISREIINNSYQRIMKLKGIFA